MNTIWKVQIMNPISGQTHKRILLNMPTIETLQAQLDKLDDITPINQLPHKQSDWKIIGIEPMLDTAGITEG